MALSLVGIFFSNEQEDKTGLAFSNLLVAMADFVEGSYC